MNHVKVAAITEPHVLCLQVSIYLFVLSALNKQVTLTKSEVCLNKNFRYQVLHEAFLLVLGVALQTGSGLCWWAPSPLFDIHVPTQASIG